MSWRFLVSSQKQDKAHINIFNVSFCLFRNLKKAQDSVFRTEKEIKDTEKEVDDLAAELKSLEDKAAEVVKNTNAAEVRLKDGSEWCLKQFKELDMWFLLT